MRKAWMLRRYLNLRVKHVCIAGCTLRLLCPIIVSACFQDPNPDDPLNKEAAQMLSNDPRNFEHLVRHSITRGHHIAGTYFPPCKA